MISIQNVSLFFGDRILFENLNISINQNEKLAITGRNGSGKSTLFKLLTRQIKPDGGQVEIPANYKIGLLRQELPEDRGLTVKQELMHSVEHIHEKELRLHEIEKLLSTPGLNEDVMMQLIEEQDDLIHSLIYLQADKLEGEIEKILQGLGFHLSDMDRPAKDFSGGWRMRIELAKLLLSKPDFLLLDEPNNHLDILSIQWLEKYLKEYPGSVLLISHDLHFLDQIANRIVELDRGRYYDYKGNYTSYKNYRAERKEIETNEYLAQQRIIQHKENLINKFRAKASKASFAQSLITELNRMDKLDMPDEEQGSMRLRFKPSHPGGRKVLEIKDLWKSYGKVEVLRGVDLFVERGEKISFIGKNGNGKTTLVKLIMQLIKPDRGIVDLGHEIKLAYYAQEHTELLDTSKDVLQTIEDFALPELRTQVRTILGGLGFGGEDVEKRVGVLSGGEKSRVRLASLLVQEHNVLILDEPTHHLDIPSKERLKEAIQHYTGTVIIVSHDRDFLQGLAQKTILFENRGIKVFEGDIDYYFEKVEKDQLFQKQANTIESANKTEKAENKKSFDERKRIQKQIQQVEKDIEKTEKAMVPIESKMADAGFYQSVEYKTTLEQYQTLKTKRDTLHVEWETLVNELGE